MKVIPVERVAGVLLFQPTPLTDERGFYCRTFDAEAARAAGVDLNGFVQDSISRPIAYDEPELGIPWPMPVTK